MNQVLWLPTFCAFILILTGCGNTNQSAANDPLGTGPFDSRGNYREDWADDPSKWSRPGKRPQPSTDAGLPAIAKNEEPPPNANPLAPSSVSTPKPASSPNPSAKPTSGPQVVAARPKPVVVKPKPKPKPKPTVTRHIVKKGDTLSAIASRYGSSVKTIQRANSISGTLIRPGQSLVIPKR